MANFALAGRVALVTGASSGLGRHFARVLAKAGAGVALTARRGDKLGEVAAEIAAAGGKAAAITCDITDGASVETAVSAALARLGRLDILVNNAGTVVSKPMLEHSEAEWDRVVDTNLKGSWLMSRAAAAHWRSVAQPGRIINIASLLALRTIRHVPSYAASKAGLVHLTHSMAMELGPHGITVNSVAPGLTASEGVLASPHADAFDFVQMLQAIPRRGMPADIAPAVAFLASEEGGWVTGQMIVADGGHTHS